MKIAILGFGVVGSGAYETVKMNPACPVSVKRILDIRIPEGMESIVTTNYQDILSDPEIEAVAEAIGGLHPAYEFVSAALRAKKHVVSANKFLICHYYRELHELAAENGVEIRFTPSVGGGIPWLYNLKRTKRADTVNALSGIMNGTTNFILDAMTTADADFGEVLAEAQRLGYAEADPSADIDGLDVRRKCAISASIAFDTVLGEEDVPTLGIRSVSAADIAYAKANGLVCKLIATAVREPNGVIAYVEPQFLPKDTLEAAIGKNFNCISLFAEKSGKLSFVGQGAGKDPTGCALIEDCIDLATECGKSEIKLGAYTKNDALRPHPYYVRTTATLPDGIADTVGDSFLLTKPLSPVAMASIAKDLLAKDAGTFIAGLGDSL